MPTPSVQISISDKGEMDIDSCNVQDYESSLNDFAAMSISSTFFPGAPTHPTASSLILLSSDSVFFYVHSKVILAASQNCFGSLLPIDYTEETGAIVLVADVSDVLNVVLHAIYDLSCAHYAPTLPTIAAALLSFTTYGLNLIHYIHPSTPLFTLLLASAPTLPVDVYALAAQHSLHDLAVSASPHLLSFRLQNLKDSDAQMIGAFYLKRLFFLHLGRVDALKRILLSPPQPHAPTDDCNFAEQRKLTRAWALASAHLAWDARPDLPGSTIESALTPLDENLWCDKCRKSLREHIRSLIVQWSVVKRTI